MSQFDTTFSERSHYRSHFFTNKLRLLRFGLWQGGLLFLLLCLIMGIALLARATDNPLWGLPDVLARPWGLPALFGVFYLICVVWPLVFGKQHWHGEPQNHRISQLDSSRITRGVAASFTALITLVVAVVWVALSWWGDGFVGAMASAISTGVFIFALPLLLLLSFLSPTIFRLQIAAGASAAALALLVIYVFWAARSLSGDTYIGAMISVTTIGALICAAGLATPMLLPGRAIPVLTHVVITCVGLLVGLMLFVLLAHLFVPADAYVRMMRSGAILLALTSTVGLSALILLVGPAIFRSKQAAIWRNVWRAVRQDRIRNDYAPIGDVVHPVNRVYRGLRRALSIHNHYLLLVIAFVGGGILIPAWQVIGDPERNYTLAQTEDPMYWSTLGQRLLFDIFLIFQNFISESLSFIGLIFGLSFAFSLYLRRQRYIFSPFTIYEQQSEAKQPEERRDLEHLRSAAYHLTQEFVDQLEQIGSLLTTRQVEDLQSPKRLPLTEFITSGGESDFLAAIQSLVDLEERPRNIPGRLLAAVIKLFAVITITGTLRRRDQTTVELEVRLSQRFGSQTSIIIPIVSSHGTDGLLDDATAAAVGRAAALKLLVRAGAVSHLASSEESLDAFLDGLSASAAQNWWRAAQSYQHAIHLEEAARGAFGVGRYHLGLALLRQGELEAGHQNLVQAERSGKPMAEIHYMLAVVLLHQYWDNLDERETEFEQIMRYSRLAVRNRRAFPEADHLIGAAHYHRGKLLDRAATRIYGPEPGASDEAAPQAQAAKPASSAASRSKAATEATETATSVRALPATARRAYDQAIVHLRRAIRSYDRSIRRLQRGVVPSPILSGELDRLRRDRMTATHQLGDALRSTGFYALAETYYEDVLAAYPNNRRTLIDLAKTLVLAENWQRADEFLSREVMIFPEGKWSADIHLYIAWAYAGGVSELVGSRRRPFIRRYLRLLKAIQDCLNAVSGKFVHAEPQPKEPHLLLGRAVSHLDYALHQRARFIACWRQTNWHAEFRRAFAAVTGEQAAPAPSTASSSAPADVPPPSGPDETAAAGAATASPTEDESFYSRAIQKPVDTSIVEYVDLLRAWLIWRIHPNAPEGTSLFDGDFPVGLPGEKGAEQYYPKPGLAKYYQEWIYLRNEMVRLVREIESSGRLHGIANAHRRLRLAALALDNWKLASEEMRKLRQEHQTSRSVTFADRWAHDVYAEISVLAIRLLAEARAFEVAWVVAMASEQAVVWCMERWIAIWREGQVKPVDPQQEFKFSPYIARYQLATVLAWKAWCADRLEQMDAVRARLVVGEDRFIGIDKNTFEDLLFKDLPKKSDIRKLLEPSAPEPDKPAPFSKEEALDRARVLLRRATQEIGRDIQNALEQAPRHPLTLWVQSQRTRAALQPEQAASEMQRLLEVLDPYDPNQSIANWHIVEKRAPAPLRAVDGGKGAKSAAVAKPAADPQQAATPPLAASENPKRERHQALRQRFGRYELVSGRRQFGNVVNLYAANEQLAAVFAGTGQYNLSIQHLMLALTQSPHWDIGADNLLLVLVQYLDQMDRLRDAYAVVVALRASRQALEANSLSIAKLYQPYLWECIILTRMRRYAESLAAGEELQRRLNGVFATFMAKGEEMYAERLGDEATGDLKPLLARVWGLFDAGSLDQPAASPPPPDPMATMPATPHPKAAPAELQGQGFPPKLVRFLNWLVELAKVLPALARDSQAADLANLLLELDVLGKKLEGETFAPPESTIEREEHERAAKILPKITINRNIALRFLDFLGEEALALIELQAQLWNNRAYNTIELRLNLGKQEGPDAAGGGDDNESPLSLVDRAINSLKALLTYPLLSAVQRTRLRRELAFYLDTKGWIYYRLARFAGLDGHAKKNLDVAQNYIDQALHYDQGSAVIYYHAARVNLTRLERSWERNVKSQAPEVTPQPSGASEEASAAQDKTSFDNYLVTVHHYWLQASRHDHRGRFKSDLAWIGLRLAEYRELWKKHLRDMGGST